MSRVGQSPITVPSGVEVKLGSGKLSVKGPKGQLDRSFPEEVSLEQRDGQILVTRNAETPQARAMHGLFRSLIANMV
ncbi:MAG: large subunit ribosomal protein, partial [Actinomycetota bacterium]|nr:large subunit ribosomal protein [Actinomycetota bacterium]